MTNVSRRPPADQTAELEQLRARLHEAESTLHAISRHGVDAFLVHRGSEEQVLVLDGVDKPYRLLIERMQQGAVTATQDGTILYANTRFSDLLCVPHSSLAGTRLTQYVLPEDWPVLNRLLEQGVKDEAEEELRVICSDDWRSVHTTISRLSEPSHLYCLIITDLTHQKRVEVERRRAVSENAAAQATTAILRETNRRKDEFLAMLAHELRGPLAPLRNGLEIIGRLAGPGPQVQEIREMMRRQIDNLVRLVDDLLDAARVTQGKITLKRTHADLTAIVTETAEACRPLAEARRQTLECVAPTVPVLGWFDQTRLAQVVLNLVNNAIKFTPEGGRITLVLEQPTPAEARIRVRDTGIGIDPKVLPEIFDLFSQASSTISRSEGGLGIGLTLARRLIEMHGGTLSGASDGLGKGSEFTVRVPLAPSTTTLTDEAARSDRGMPRARAGS